MRQNEVVVVGAGLAGSEAAWQLAQRGVNVTLYEMRPKRMTEAHSTEQFAELVCSNSLGSDDPGNASRILKDELEVLGAFVLSHARRAQVPAGRSLAVDREVFSREITDALSHHPRITIKREALTELPTDTATLVATGPLTTPELVAQIQSIVGGSSLYFYDAISPIVSTDSLDLNQMYYASRYGKGDPDFLNIPLTREQYDTFVDSLMKAEVVLAHDFEEEKYFEGCMPIETIASRGKQTLAFGPMRPVGLNDPKSGKRPHAVIQLRTENQFRTAYNLVGFQTKMKYPEQQRIFRALPGLAQAEFLRLGSMHRNTYVDSPRVLLPSLRLKNSPNVFLAGQLTGTEGYLESSATGLVAALSLYEFLKARVIETFPASTLLGSLLRAITDPERKDFQPMNVNFGILPPLEVRPKDRPQRNGMYAARSATAIKQWKLQNRSLFKDESPESYMRAPQSLAEREDRPAL